jgi:phage baseplate assembly protein W
MAFYKGFSTIGLQNKWKLEDVELVKRDLMNHFQTRRGERLNNLEFGSRIWEYTFEQMTDELREAIAADVQNIINSDPRVRSKDVTIQQFQNGFQIEMDLYFVLTDQSEKMYVQFNNQQRIMTSL